MDAATLQSDSKSNLGNYLVDEIYTATQLSTSLHNLQSYTVFYIVYKEQNLPF